MTNHSHFYRQRLREVRLWLGDTTKHREEQMMTAWTDAEVDDARRLMDDEDNVRAGVRSIMSRAASLVAARGGTMTAATLEAVLRDMASEHPNGVERIRQHLATQGAKLAALEESLDNENARDAQLLRDLGATESETLRGACLRVVKERDEMRGGMVTAARERDEARAELVRRTQRVKTNHPAALQEAIDRWLSVNKLTAHEVRHVVVPLGAAMRWIERAQSSEAELARRKAAAEVGQDLLARLKPSGQVAEDERALHVAFCRGGDGACAWNPTAHAALSRLATGAQQAQTAPVAESATTDPTPPAATVDGVLWCAACEAQHPHRFRPSPEAGPFWRCSNCSEVWTPQATHCTCAGEGVCAWCDETLGTPDTNEAEKGPTCDVCATPREDMLWMCDSCADAALDGRESKTRAACWEAVQVKLREFGMYEGPITDALRSAIEGATP